MTTALVTVRGEAELSCPPDLATISATVHRTGPDADRVRRELAEASTRVRAIVDFIVREAKASRQLLMGEPRPEMRGEARREAAE